MSRYEKPEDIDMQNKIRERANYSLALLGKAFVYRTSGRFLNIDVLERNIKSLEKKFN